MSDLNGKLITVKEARKLLGNRYSGMTDDDIRKIIDELSLLAKLTLEDAKVKLSKGEL